MWLSSIATRGSLSLWRNFDGEVSFIPFESNFADPNSSHWRSLPSLPPLARREFPNSSVVWLDSGLTFGGGHGEDFLEAAVEAAAANDGVLSDHTARSLEEFTHAGTFAYFDKHFGYPRSFFVDSKEKVLNCNGAFSAWESVEESARRQGQRSQHKARPPFFLAGAGAAGADAAAAAGSGLAPSISDAAVSIWEQCALARDCICPAGSSRRNHRQDQAALTLALATQGKRCYGSAPWPDGSARGPFGNATDWVHAHGLRMKSVLCQDARCFVEKHAPACLLRKKEAEATKRIRQ